MLYCMKHGVKGKLEGTKYLFEDTLNTVEGTRNAGSGPESDQRWKIIQD